MLEFSLSRASSFRTGCGDGMLGLSVGDGKRALFEKRASSSVTRLLMSCRDKLGRSSKKEFNLSILAKIVFFEQKLNRIEKRIFEEARVVSETVVNDEKDDLIVILGCGLGS